MTQEYIIAKLNVGGIMYYTNKEKLVKSSRYFEALLNGDMKETKTKNDQEIFIDKDGELFEYILNFIRTNELSRHLEEDMLLMIKQDAEYYQMPKLTAYIDSFKNVKNDYSLVKLSDLLKVKGVTIFNERENARVYSNDNSRLFLQSLNVASMESFCTSNCGQDECSHYKAALDHPVTHYLLRKIPKLD